MPMRTVPAFVAYEGEAGGQGIPLVAVGSSGEVYLAAPDTTKSGATATAYRLKNGAPHTPFANIHSHVTGFRVEAPEDCPGIWFVSTNPVTGGTVESYQGFLEGSRGRPGTPGSNTATTEEAVRTVIGDDLDTPNSNLRTGVAGIIAAEVDTDGSPVQAATDTRYWQKHQLQPTANTVFKEHPEGYRYEVTRVNCHGQPAPGILRKVYANDFEKTSPGGNEFIVPAGQQESLKSFAARTGADILSNSTGWQTAVGAQFQMIRGPQIKDGVIYRDFETNSNRGRHALGVHADGTIHPYMAEDGWTATTLLADGVVDTFTFGPLLVANGAQRDVEADTWSSSLTDGRKSARTILGATADHDVVLIHVAGKSTPATGVGGNAMARLAAEEGCINAILLDGGGSTQAAANGFSFHPSADSASFRLIGDALLVYARVTQAPDSSQEQGPEPIELAAGYKGRTAAYTPAVVVRAGKVALQGQIAPNSGSFAASTWIVVGQLPDKARPARPDGAGVLAVGAFASAGKAGKIQIRDTGELSIQVPEPDVYIDLSAVTYDAY